MTDSKVVLNRFARLYEDPLAKRVPYFTAEEVGSLLELLGVSVPVSWIVWCGEGNSEVQPYMERLNEAMWNMELSEPSYKGPKHRTETYGIRTLSAARVVEVILNLSEWAEDIHTYDEELEIQYGSRFREKEGRQYKQWWYVAYELLRDNPEFRHKRFPDFF